MPSSPRVASQQENQTPQFSELDYDAIYHQPPATIPARLTNLGSALQPAPPTCWRRAALGRNAAQRTTWNIRVSPGRGRGSSGWARAGKDGRTDADGRRDGRRSVRREKTGCRAKERTNKRTNGPRSSLCDERRRKSRSLGFTNSSSRIKCDLVTKNEPDRQTYTNDLPSSRLICLHNSWTGTTTLQNGVRSGSRA